MKKVICSYQILIAVIFLAAVVSVHAGSLEPSAPPGPTMKTLDEIPPSWSQILSSNDGEADGCNSSRYRCVMGGVAVLDLETGLVWERVPDVTKRNWGFAESYCRNKAVGNRKGWRLPTIQELASLADPSQTAPSLPVGNPFSNIQSDFYSSLTINTSNRSFIILFDFNSGAANITGGKSDLNYSLCVRGGQGYSTYTGF